MARLLLVTLCLVCLSWQQVSAESVCYDDLGCFSNDPPFDVFNSFPPKSPDYINTEFLLYTRANTNRYLKVDRTDASSLQSSTFNSGRRTVFIIHGYTEKGSESIWMRDLKDALLAVENLNVFIIDWGNGARNLYGQSVQNTRVVGRVIARFMQFLNTETGANFARMHIIGHSLGAHTAGYAGAFQSGIGRISGLDPAGPYYTSNDPACRLDASDAIFVDVIHTDAEAVGAGIVAACGHMDFYPNSGKEQPGCPPSLVDISDPLSEIPCSHVRVLDLYIESVTQCDFVGYPCSNWDKFVNGQCTSCSWRGCPKMGYWADLSSASGNFYLQTGAKSPFCNF
ncbi:pancreatic lipase-related protein 2-like [Patiria miniata]|uniref:Lipase domain-containing protein n=1 Tax=Patiria miniata TaxID=46514 RepID=A0A914BC81_PATMI|nr:pancreatic lipase-related protein 2-like [Patiria miniata]